MKNIQKKTIITWLKRFISFLAIMLWLYIILNISNMNKPFLEQAPYCMGTTMLIFTLLSLVFKTLEYWEKQK